MLYNRKIKPTGKGCLGRQFDQVVGKRDFNLRDSTCVVRPPKKSRRQSNSRSQFRVRNSNKFKKSNSMMSSTSKGSTVSTFLPVRNVDSPIVFDRFDRDAAAIRAQRKKAGNSYSPRSAVTSYISLKKNFEKEDDVEEALNRASNEVKSGEKGKGENLSARRPKLTLVNVLVRSPKKKRRMYKPVVPVSNSVEIAQDIVDRFGEVRARKMNQAYQRLEQAKNHIKYSSRFHSIDYMRKKHYKRKQMAYKFGIQENGKNTKEKSYLSAVLPNLKKYGGSKSNRLRHNLKLYQKIRLRQKMKKNEESVNHFFEYNKNNPPLPKVSVTEASPLKSHFLKNKRKSALRKKKKKERDHQAFGKAKQTLEGILKQNVSTEESMKQRRESRNKVSRDGSLDRSNKFNESSASGKGLLKLFITKKSEGSGNTPNPSFQKHNMMTSISTNGENFFIWKMYNGQPEKKPKEFNIKEFLGLLVEELTIFVTGQNNEWSSETKLKTALDGRIQDEEALSLKFELFSEIPLIGFAFFEEMDRLKRSGKRHKTIMFFDEDPTKIFTANELASAEFREGIRQSAEQHNISIDIDRTLELEMYKKQIRESVALQIDDKHPLHFFTERHRFLEALIGLYMAYQILSKTNTDKRINSLKTLVRDMKRSEMDVLSTKEEFRDAMNHFMLIDPRNMKKVKRRGRKINRIIRAYNYKSYFKHSGDSLNSEIENFHQKLGETNNISDSVLRTSKEFISSLKDCLSSN